MLLVNAAVGRRLALLVAVALFATAGAAPAHAASVTRQVSFTADDGVVLRAIVGGEGSLASRPLIVEDSPYAPGIDSFAGSAYNYVELQWRGTGQSGGSLASAGPRDQRDLAEFMGWACRQPWSDGRIAQRIGITDHLSGCFPLLPGFRGGVRHDRQVIHRSSRNAVHGRPHTFSRRALCNNHDELRHSRIARAVGIEDTPAARHS